MIELSGLLKLLSQANVTHLQNSFVMVVSIDIELMFQESLCYQLKFEPFALSRSLSELVSTSFFCNPFGSLAYQLNLTITREEKESIQRLSTPTPLDNLNLALQELVK